MEVKPTEVKPEQKVSQRPDEIETSGNVVPENTPDYYDAKLMMYNLFGELVEIPGAKKRRNKRQGLPKEQKQPQHHKRLNLNRLSARLTLHRHKRQPSRLKLPYQKYPKPASDHSPKKN